MINFCTLFDSNYIDKALVMYNSLQRVGTDFMLYIMCFDESSYSILAQMQLKKVVLNLSEELENDTPALLDVKNHRTKAEYCWTCTAASIRFFMQKYNLANCTYIDADLYFFANPQVLYDEIAENAADVAIMEHRFTDKKSDIKTMQTRGKYCVEFNYFNMTNNARQTLLWWEKACLEWCYQKYEPAQNGRTARYGDQKYLEQFQSLFNGVYVMQHLGAGVAPWNLSQYQLVKNNEDGITLKHTQTRAETQLIFYHFQNLKYINSNLININSLCKDKKLKYAIYYPYLYEISKMRNKLENEFGLTLSTKKSYSNNIVKAFIQRHIMPYRVRTLSDVISIKRILKNR